MERNTKVTIANSIYLLGIALFCIGILISVSLFGAILGIPMIIIGIFLIIWASGIKKRATGDLLEKIKKNRRNS